MTVLQTAILPPKIISGGQSGADQGALFAARELGFETGGFAPRGFVTENGHQKEMLSGFGLRDSGLTYGGRTKLNVRESDVTIWFGSCDSAGYFATARAATAAGKPLVIASAHKDDYLASVILSHPVINVAGHRESHSSGMFEDTKRRMKKILSIVKEMKQ